MKILGIALMVAGIILIGFGMNAADSLGSSISRFFSGTPTDRSLWLLLGGAATAVVGALMSLRPAR